MTRRLLGRTVRLPQLLAAALAVVLLVTAGVAASTSTASFGSHNPAWDGGRDLRLLADDPGTETILARNASRYGTVEPTESVAFVLSPDEPYSDASADRLETFVREGGTLVVADDFGAATNPLLADLGVTSRVNGTLLRDERHNYRGPAFPVADNVSSHPLTQDVERVTINHGSVVAPGPDATVFIQSSEYGYLDTNGNEQLDDVETLDSYPVAVVESHEEGRVVVLSDPSIFINTMLDQPDNQQFARNLIGDADTVLFDYSHARAFPPLVALLVVVRESLVLQIGVIGLLATVLAAGTHPRAREWLRRRTGDEEPRGGLIEDEVIEAVSRQHPDWNRSRVERVTEGIISRRTDREDDG